MSKLWIIPFVNKLGASHHMALGRPGEWQVLMAFVTWIALNLLWIRSFDLASAICAKIETILRLVFPSRSRTFRRVAPTVVM
jgi:hypothetical protein